MAVAYGAAVITVATSTDQVLAATSAGVGWITLNRPDKHNALSAEMMAGLTELVARWDVDPEVRVIVVRGAGDRAFVSGADIGQFGTGVDAAPERRHPNGMLPTAKPVIAMIQGYCIGAGLSVALSADLRVASSDATFAIPAGRLGLAYPVDDLERLVALVGSGEASRLMLTAERFDAAHGLRVGLVHEVVEHADLEARVAALADTVATLAPLTMRASKLAIMSAVRGGRSPYREAADAAAARCWASDDFAEGLAAFAEKRPPTWSGR